MKRYREIIDKALQENKLFAEFYAYGNDFVSYIIENGDWKHEHLRFETIVKNCFPNALLFNLPLGESDSDCYSSVHTIFLGE